MSQNNLQNRKMSAKKIAFCAICIALSFAASLITPYKFPFGGNVTMFSMLIIVLPSWFYGVKEGVLCGLCYGLIQFILAPYMISIPQFLLDYILAFSVMGVAGLFKEKKNGLLKGYIVAVIARWIIATLAGLAWIKAGYTAWENWDPIPYSMAYNGAYIFTEAFATVLILFIPALKNALNRIKKLSNE